MNGAHVAGGPGRRSGWSYARCHPQYVTPHSRTERLPLGPPHLPTRSRDRPTIGHRGAIGRGSNYDFWRGSRAYSRWNRAIVFPSGSLNHADFPMPRLVPIESTVLNAGKSYSSKTTPLTFSSWTSVATSLVQNRTCVWSAWFGLPRRARRRGEWCHPRTRTRGGSRSSPGRASARLSARRTLGS
jgi:hypothetical protein